MGRGHGSCLGLQASVGIACSSIGLSSPLSHISHSIRLYNLPMWMRIPVIHIVVHVANIRNAIKKCLELFIMVLSSLLLCCSSLGLAASVEGIRAMMGEVVDWERFCRILESPALSRLTRYFHI